MLTFFYYAAWVYQHVLKINADCNQDERRRSFSVESHSSLSHFSDSLKRQRRNFFDNLEVLSAILWFNIVNWSRIVSGMGTKMKEIYKGFKYTVSQFFVVKEEHEMQIGCPTDVKHVAHIGWDGSSGTAPTWMNGFQTGNDFAATSIGNSGSALSPWSSRDFSESMLQQPESEMLKDIPSTDPPSVKKREKRKKPKSTSSPRSNSSYSSRPARPGKPKPKFIEDNAEPTNIEVT